MPPEGEHEKVVYKGCTQPEEENGQLSFQGVRMGESPQILANRNLNMSLIEEWYFYLDPDVEETDPPNPNRYIVVVYFTGEDPEEEPPVPN